VDHSIENASCRRVLSPYRSETIMTLTQDQLDKLQARVLDKLDKPTDMQNLDLSSKGLALCIIDSI